MSWYEDDDQFAWDATLPQEFFDCAGPHGVALVDVYAAGRTTPGWGLMPGKTGTFMENYPKRKFHHRPRLLRFTKDKPYAIVMRSVTMLMVDIDRHLDDGGADGFIAAADLGLTPTLAETSKSGSGRHLFYRVPDTWLPTQGYAKYDDVIGLAPGIDIRAVGCAYRYPTQMWNHEELADLPDSIRDLLDERAARKTATQNLLAATAAAPDTEEALIMQDALMQELAKPIAPGKRNNTLFAIGSKMNQAGVQDWQKHLAERANEVGIDSDEAVKIIDNVVKYG